MSNLKVLLIQSNPDAGCRIAAALEEAQHFVMPAISFEEASEALLVQQWDAVLLSSPIASDGLANFAAQLRQIDNDDRRSVKTPLVSVVARPSNGSDTLASENEAVDVILAEPFEAQVFAEVVDTLAQRLAVRTQQSIEHPASLPVFESEEFAQQLAYDRDLIVEIIDLFLEERATQMEDMSEALELGDFPRLSRAAHTIKGSFGSLHAPRARLRANDLEMAAKNGDDQICCRLLPALEEDLDELIPLLLMLRNA